MRAASPNSQSAILIAGISGRALAQAARRAGLRPLVTDLFGDQDARAAAAVYARLPGSLRDGIDADRLAPVLHDLVQTIGQPADSIPLVLGSGFEQQPELIDALAQTFELAGCGCAAIRAVKNPQWLAHACARLRIPHPATRFDVPREPADWLVKSAGAAGGTHVRRAGVEIRAPGRYFQRRIEGENISALFIADHHQAHIVGFSRQWTSPVPGAAWRYGGSARINGVAAETEALVGAWLDGLTRRAGLRGLCSADFIRSDGAYTLIEINPRPGATLDIFDSSAAPLLKAHLDACRGNQVALPRHSDSKAAVVAYANAPIQSFPPIQWPEWVADRQSAATQVQAGDPVCTVFGNGSSAREAQRQALERLHGLQGQWSEAQSLSSCS